MCVWVYLECRCRRVNLIFILLFFFTIVMQTGHGRRAMAMSRTFWDAIGCLQARDWDAMRRCRTHSFSTTQRVYAHSTIMIVYALSHAMNTLLAVRKVEQVWQAGAPMEARVAVPRGASGHHGVHGHHDDVRALLAGHASLSQRHGCHHCHGRRQLLPTHGR